MAIRFQCGSCSQPIEVDDEWAMKAVACPYCRKTITAPAESTLGDVQQIPVATGLRPPPAHEASVAPTMSPADLALVQHPNTIAKVALVLVCVQVMVVITMQRIGASHLEEAREISELVLAESTTGGQLRAWADYFESHGGYPKWLITLYVLFGTLSLLWIAGLVCSLIGVRRVQRRGLAVAALAVTGLVPLFFCCGGAFY